MAIEILKRGDATGSAAGPFTLPPEFDTKAHSAKWVKKGPAVNAAAEREYIIGTRMTADGWAVWKNQAKPHTVSVASGEYILLFRPRPIQEAVNAIYGNVGKERMLSEKKGETMGGEPVADSGMLGEGVLTKQLGSEGLGADEGDVKMNPVDFGDRVDAPELQTAT